MDQPDLVTQSSTQDRIHIERYSPAHREEWDSFVANSKNGTFLFLRDYLDYLGEAIEDCSLLVRDDRNRIVAVLPGHVEGSTYLSHGRLTYGGFITEESTRLPLMIRVFDAALTWLRDAGMQACVYKTIPHIYHRVPAEEDRYALSLIGAEWVRSGMLAVVRPAARVPYQDRRRRAIKKARDRGLTVRATDDYPEYWRLLSQVLMDRYQTNPVHSLEQIETLRAAFPDNIRLHACFDGSEMLAGVVVYKSARVARAQYIASSSGGRAAGALDLVIDHLITGEYAHIEAIDLGTSDEHSGRVLNVGLIDQKEGFGARAVALDQYRIDLNGWESGTLVGALR